MSMWRVQVLTGDEAPSAKSDSFSLGLMMWEGLTRLLIGQDTGFLERCPQDRFRLSDEHRQGLEACLSSHAPSSMAFLANRLTSNEAEDREEMDSAAAWLSDIAQGLRSTVTQADADDAMATLQVRVHAHLHIPTIRQGREGSEMQRII